MPQARTRIQKLLRDPGPGALILSGISVILAIAASSSWVQYAFMASGLSVLMGLAGLRLFQGKSLRRRIFGNVLMFGVVAATWIVLWRFIPKPPEALATNDIRSAVKEAMSAVALRDMVSFAKVREPQKLLSRPKPS